jgi:branched-chain amino acid aminotransferase
VTNNDYANRDGFIWLDGKLVPWRKATAHILTHAMHYASAVFEGQRAYGGSIFRLSDHSQRLHESARMLDFEIPWSVGEVDAASEAVLSANSLSDAYVRPIAWRGSEQMGLSAEGTTTHLAIAAWPWGKYLSASEGRAGIRLDIASYRRPAPYTAPVHAKASGLYMIATISKQRAEKRGFDDALMLDWRGQIAEATGANAFFVKDETLHTPAADCFLNGLTRQTVIELARRRGVAVVERAIWPEELENFQEMFVTGSAAEVTFVDQAGPWSFEVGPLSRQLRDDYSDAVNGRGAFANARSPGFWRSN